MRCCLLVLSLLACSCRALNYTGSAFTYHPLNGTTDTAVVRYKVAFQECNNLTFVNCQGELCTVNLVSVNFVDENSGEWCQYEVIVHVNNSEAPFHLALEGINWIDNIDNIMEVHAPTYIELRTRSDTGRPNSSPRTTMLPIYRVPSNCHRVIRLPMYDTDGDRVYCYEKNNIFEEFYFFHKVFYPNEVSDPHRLKTTPSSSPSLVLTAPSLQHGYLVYHGVQGVVDMEGAYAVELIMKDFPHDNLALTDPNGVQTFHSKMNPLSEVPIQFVLKVDPPVDSCRPGDIVPEFESPTPEDEAHLYAFVNHTLNIEIYASAVRSSVEQVLFSGPAGIQKKDFGGGHFVLSWTPTVEDSGLRHAICFVVEAILDQDRKIHSEMRCVIVAVDHLYFALNARLLVRSHLPVLKVIERYGLKGLKEELIKRGLPNDIQVRLGWRIKENDFMNDFYIHKNEDFTTSWATPA
ncbi:uncharacterized protein LOC119129662 [Syngnathus acus]|uniref:uncharacterized protein LOC119129662 n=1 Tax=Syngnathus acus TaxID=161584 RepID=UPI0018863A46|nr:uncharacterized protein LOC119129662 [Syngnathus acus]